MIKRIGEGEGDEGDAEFIKFDFKWDEEGEEGEQRALARFERVNEEPSLEEYEANGN